MMLNFSREELLVIIALIEDVEVYTDLNIDGVDLAYLKRKIRKEIYKETPNAKTVAI